MASYVSINLHYEVTQTRLTFCQPGSPSCRFLFVIEAYVNRGALLFCSALHQNLFRIRNLILPRALLASDQSAHLQISEQINLAIFRASALFTFCNFQRTSALCPRHVAGRMAGSESAGGEECACTPAGGDECARHGRKRSGGHLAHFKFILGGEPGRCSQLYRKI